MPDIPRRDFFWECDYGIRTPVIEELAALLDTQTADELNMVALWVNNNLYNPEFYVGVCYESPQAHQIPEMIRRLSGIGLRMRTDLSLEALLTAMADKRFNSSTFVNGADIRARAHTLFLFPDREQMAARLPVRPLGAGAPVFLSHSSTDKPDVEALIPYLTAASLPVWYDKVSIDYGQSLTDALQQGVERSKAVIFWVTSAFLNSSWCKTEARNFINRHSGGDAVLLISVLAPDVQRDQLPLFLREPKYLQRRADTTVADVAAELLPSLRRFFAR